MESFNHKLANDDELSPHHCNKTALTDTFGWILQVILACLAFTCLIGK